MGAKLKGALRQNNWQAAKDAEDAAGLIKALGEKRREILRIEHDMNDKVGALKLEFEARAQPLKDAVEQIISAVQAWAEANRDELTQGGKVKTVKLATGEFNWRARPPKVGLRGREKIIESLKALGLTRFLRVSEEIDKDALLKEKNVAAQVSGVSISSAGEDFAIAPYELEIEDKQ